MEPALLEALRRNSGLRVDGNGDFFFHERPVENVRVQGLFHRHLAVRDDGEVTLTVGTQWAYVVCETVARFVDAISLEQGVLKARLRDGQHVVEAAPRLGFAPDGRCYVWLGEAQHPAVLNRPAHQALAELLEVRGEIPGLPLASGFSVVATLAEVPSAAAQWPG